MSYNITLLDKSGKYKTIYLTPDKGPHVDIEKVATNHQQDIEWLEYAAFTATKERKAYLDYLVDHEVVHRDELIHRFLEPPLYNKDLHKHFVTLYTMQYDLEGMYATVFWPNKKLEQSFDKFYEGRVFIPMNKMNHGEFNR